MIFPTTAKETADKLRAYLPEFVRPVLDRLVARVEYEAAGRVLDALRGCQLASAQIEEGCEVGRCRICERFQPVDRPCALRARAGYLQESEAAASRAAAFAQLREEFGPYFDRIADVDAWVAAVRRGDDPPAAIAANEDQS